MNFGVKVWPFLKSEFLELGTSIRKIAIALLLISMALGNADSVRAQTYTWSGGSSANGNWSTTSNWSGGAAPASSLTSTAIIMTGTTQTSNNIDTNISINSLTFNTVAGSFSIGGSGILSIGSGGISITDNNNQLISASLTLGADQIWTNSGTGTFTVNGAITNGGFGLAIAGSGNTTINGAISGSGALSMTGSGTLSLTGSNGNFTGPITISSGTVNAAGTVNSSGVTVSLGSGAISIASGATLIINGTSNPSINSGISASTNNLSGAGILNLATVGTAGNDTYALALTGSLASFMGTINISGNGKMLFLPSSGSSGVPSASATINVDANATFYVNSAITIPSSVNLYGGTTGEQLGQLRLENGAAISGNVVLFANTTIGNLVANSTPTTGIISGNISGAYQLTSLAQGTFILSGTNSYGATVLNAYAGGTVGGGGTLQIGNGGTTGTLGSGSVTNNSILSFDRSNTVSVANAISGTGAVNQIGLGTLILSGNNSYSGATTVSAGTLLINGTNSGTGTVTVGNGTTTTGALGGSGSIAGAVTINSGSTISGGVVGSPATLTLNGGLTLNSGSIYTVNLAITGSGTNAISGSMLSVTGAASLNSSSIVLNLNGVSASTFESSVGAGKTDMFEILSTTGSLTGAPANNSVANFTGFTSGEWHYETTANSLSLQFTPAPESQTIALWSLLGMVGGALIQRRRTACTT